MSAWLEVVRSDLCPAQKQLSSPVGLRWESVADLEESRSLRRFVHVRYRPTVLSSFFLLPSVSLTNGRRKRSRRKTGGKDVPSSSFPFSYKENSSLHPLLFSSYLSALVSFSFSSSSRFSLYVQILDQLTAETCKRKKLGLSFSLSLAILVPSIQVYVHQHSLDSPELPSLSFYWDV